MNKLDVRDKVSEDVPEKNLDFDGKVLSVIVTILFLIFTPMMLYSFWEDNWTILHYLIFGSLVLLTVGLVINAFSPKYGWWSYRLISFIIFISYFCYLYDQTFHLNLPTISDYRMSEPNFINALLGFVLIGLPALLYTFSGSVNENNENHRVIRLIYNIRIILFKVSLVCLVLLFVVRIIQFIIY